ncbi:carbon-nitrogen hydrolase family protein [Cryobacterium sp. SO1]|uniref:carbon-nitrogen hydrolase family protein n=1 Tax=Cryobacterium sp. SO1 TaxID=1897061 RepID=UPI001023EDCA|nr:carbon-nitrogen hydrolase family protein [Cryobacterium sp. SO1]RZI35612.1 Aliphatic nitrilase [Cryobacterium sp. SO1]
MPDSTRIATVQAEPVWFDLAATTDKTLDLIADAARGGAQLVAFPETWLPGYPLFLWSHTPADQVSFVAGYHLNSVDVNGAEIQRIRQSARANQIWVVLGISERLHGTLYISQLIIDDEGVVRLHRRKLKPTHVERSLFGEGDGSGLQVVETPFGRVGGLNCWEHLQPLVKFAMYAQNEQIHVASWPCFSIPAHHYTLTSDASLAASQTYAMEGGCFVLVANQVMTAVGAQRLGVPVEILAAGAGAGVARVYGPDGSPLTELLDADQEGLVFADLNLAAVAAAKAYADPVGHYARPDVFRLTVDRSARVPAHLTDAEPTAGSAAASAAFTDLPLASTS